MLLDNKTHGKVGDWLEKVIAKNSILSVISRQFSIYAYKALKDKLESVQTFRLILSQLDSGQGRNAPSLGLTGDASERAWRNQLTMPYTARNCAQWLEKKGQVKMIATGHMQNFFHILGNGQCAALHGSSSFNGSGLGFTRSSSFEMNTATTDPDETASLGQWFEAIWQDSDTSNDITATILQELQNLYSSKSPENIYYLILSHLFQGLSANNADDFIIKSRTGIQDTLIWKMLYKFQRDGVLGAIDKLEKYNGCIIADSVGLGKTFEALAVIKYYELRNDRVLVLCPKKIRENWTVYRINDKRNLLAQDRFNFDVLNHTDLTRESGFSGDIDLRTLYWGNYDLVVIDESHNFRNNPSKKEGRTRYSRLMQDIIQSGVKTKVLMLSATPVNNRMNDLKNQVAFITEGNDQALAHENIGSIEECLRKAQAVFNEWLRQDADRRTTADLLDSLNLDYFKLLDLLTIARSRKHIEKYYNVQEVGDFPERAKPINIKADIDTNE